MLGNSEKMLTFLLRTTYISTFGNANTHVRSLQVSKAFVLLLMHDFIVKVSALKYFNYFISHKMPSLYYLLGIIASSLCILMIRNITKISQKPWRFCSVQYMYTVNTFKRNERVELQKYSIKLLIFIDVVS